MSNKKNLYTKAVLGVVAGLATTTAPLAAQNWSGGSASCSGQASPYSSNSYSSGQSSGCNAQTGQPFPSYSYTYAPEQGAPQHGYGGQGYATYANPYEGHPEYSQYQSMENNGLAQERANNQWPRLNNGDGQFHTGQYNTNTPTWLPQNQNNVADKNGNNDGGYNANSNYNSNSNMNSNMNSNNYRNQPMSAPNSNSNMTSPNSNSSYNSNSNMTSPNSNSGNSSTSKKSPETE